MGYRKGRHTQNKLESASVREGFYERVSKKASYLNPEIVQVVWEAAVKVAVEDLKKNKRAFLPNLAKITVITKTGKGIFPAKIGGFRGRPEGEEFYTLRVNVNRKLGRYFSNYLQNQKKLQNLVPESPSTLVK